MSSLYHLMIFQVNSVFRLIYLAGARTRSLSSFSLVPLSLSLSLSLSGEEIGKKRHRLIYYLRVWWLV
jgi:hypothetical protein